MKKNFEALEGGSIMKAARRMFRILQPTAQANPMEGKKYAGSSWRQRFKGLFRHCFKLLCFPRVIHASCSFYGALKPYYRSQPNSNHEYAV